MIIVSLKVILFIYLAVCILLVTYYLSLCSSTIKDYKKEHPWCRDRQKSKRHRPLYQQIRTILACLTFFIPILHVIILIYVLIFIDDVKEIIINTFEDLYYS